ncbi:unnamed protein product [Spirodela intermedia]|uniref:Uncharacterized protein n=1 Tax=Spirodela intermedia TaxID=51605 RepID=A0A7I8IJJ8_SPIIN|nr:unnamed protein product [Spirodela intermedia]CAA6657670.1 unnamed protein product [Spirodela intermedia]
MAHSERWHSERKWGVRSVNFISTELSTHPSRDTAVIFARPIEKTDGDGDKQSSIWYDEHYRHLVTSYKSLGYSRPRKCSPSPSLRIQKLSLRCRVRAQVGIILVGRASSRPFYISYQRLFPLEASRGSHLHRLLHLGRKALKGFLLAAFFLSFASDLVSSFSRSRELVIPLGLIIGVTVADFLVETSKELFQSPKQAHGYGRKLLGVGTVFACIKLLNLYTALPGRMVLTYIGNGGLMQVLWLAWQVQEKDSDKDLEFPATPEQTQL